MPWRRSTSARTDFFRDLAAAAGALDPDSFADQYTALVEGTLILRQVHGRDDAARTIKPAVEALLASSLGSQPISGDGAAARRQSL